MSALSSPETIITETIIKNVSQPYLSDHHDASIEDACLLLVTKHSDEEPEAPVSNSLKITIEQTFLERQLERLKIIDFKLRNKYKKTEPETWHCSDHHSKCGQVPCQTSSS